MDGHDGKWLSSCIVLPFDMGLIMAAVEVKCRFCFQTDPVMKHGWNPRSIPLYRYLECKRSFLLDYAYEACRPGVQEKIVDMAINSAGL